MKSILEKEGTHCYLKAYEIIVTGPDSGFLEFVKDSMSIDSLKKKYPRQPTLKKLFEYEFGSVFEEAQL